jgi:hypothetical protein
MQPQDYSPRHQNEARRQEKSEHDDFPGRYYHFTSHPLRSFNHFRVPMV